MNENNGRRVFIGHGRAPVWRELKEFLSEKLKLPVDEFNRISVAGIPTVTCLTEMLDHACFAFLIMTAEDEQSDRKLHARLNVIHEAGLFQGRLGFNKAIILLEEGCEEFSNVHGLGQIRFPKDSISAKFEDIRSVLEREKSAQTPNVTLVEVRTLTPDPNGPPLHYPLKYRVTLRNDSKEIIDVSLSRYTPISVILKDFPLNVLQLNLNEQYCPRPDGVRRISVLPDQLFRAWIGVDEKVFTKDLLDSLRGRIGTLVFSINGQAVDISL